MTQFVKHSLPAESCLRADGNFVREVIRQMIKEVPDDNKPLSLLTIWTPPHPNLRLVIEPRIFFDFTEDQPIEKLAALQLVESAKQALA